MSHTPEKSLSFHSCKILVLGDVMLDRYWHGPAGRLSPEAPVPVVNIQSSEERLGGAANVALNLSKLGCSVTLLATTGEDVDAICLEKQLSGYNIDFRAIKLPQYQTIAKLRIIAQQQQLLRLDHEAPYTAAHFEQLLTEFKQIVSSYDMIILSDYAKGTLQDPQAIIKISNDNNVPVIVDPKLKDFAPYANANLIKPNLKEFETIVGPCRSSEILEEKAHQVMQKHNIQTLVVTQGEQGLSIIQAGQPLIHFRAYSGEVYDVTGAGDTVCALLAAALSANFPLKTAAYLSSIAAGIVVGKLGTSAITLVELQQALLNQQAPLQGLVTKEQLKTLIQNCQQHGERIVFVNGCYDVIHFGHIRYLAKAKNLGDKLVVAINSDASIKRLKGNDRPIHMEAERAEVLAALNMVDWVVTFEENTPGKLVEFLTPDILVKGTEHFNSVADIPETEGAHHVLAHGGEVQLIARTPNCSSSHIIGELSMDLNQA